MTKGNKELLFRMTKDDFEFEYFCSGGKGGQNQNKVASGCRIRHLESGAVSECRRHRDQIQNKREAFKKLTETKEFKLWHRIKCAKMMGQAVDVETWLSDQMQPKNLKIEEIQI